MPVIGDQSVFIYFHCKDLRINSDILVQFTLTSTLPIAEQESMPRITHPKTGILSNNVITRKIASESIQSGQNPQLSLPSRVIQLATDTDVRNVASRMMMTYTNNNNKPSGIPRSVIINKRLITGTTMRKASPNSIDFNDWCIA